MSDSDLIGKSFGRLKVLSTAPNGPQGHKMFLCQCECGQQKPMRKSALLKSGYLSCGCGVAIAATTHGGTGSREFKSWDQMKQRCLNEKHHAFADYGGRGITVCERWNSFENFLADMGPRPPGTSIDRHPDKNGNYEPGNCRWATQKQQCRNRRNNRLYEYQGQSKTLGEWAEIHKTNVQRLRDRIRSGWNITDALTIPKGGHRA